MANKVCTKCKIERPLSSFYKRKNSKDGHNSICKYCLKISKSRKYLHIKENTLYCTICKEYKTDENFDVSPERSYRRFRDNRCKKCKQNQTIKRANERAKNNSISRTLSERYLNLVLRNKKYNTLIDFDVDYLLHLWDEQKELCALSGIHMTYIIRKGRIPTNVSIDRIDSTKGYTKNNIHLVCMAVNQMKSDLTIEELIYFCKNIVNHVN